MKDLDEKGYCVIPNVLASEECDVRMEAYRDWLAKFPEGDWPLNEESLIMTYRIGHFKPTWQVRLGVRKVFEVLWCVCVFVCVRESFFLSSSCGI